MAQERPPQHERPAPPSATISDEFPFESHYVEVLGSKMHYVDEGEGDPILFLHGNPTSSYLWRNVIPHLKGSGRLIAPDLIGMGKSDKPDIPYRFEDHARYLDAFIEKLGLKNITLVVHDWGSGLGFHYAVRHPDNIAGIAFMEALLPFPEQFERHPFGMFAMLRDPVKGKKAVMEDNVFVEKILPMSVKRKLTETEMNAYRAPFPTVQSRLPVYVWPQEVPFDDGPEDIKDMIRNYTAWFEKSDMPKLLIYGDPGAIIPPGNIERFIERFPHLETHFVGVASHFLQEDHPHNIGRAIWDWHRREIKGK
ncbi:MAG: haloalkane dehalogenase [Alphaproteobacteria bacterium]|nr:MAG: haloalkane dehalogenase [Alphaproteobacteria bacterium]